MSTKKKLRVGFDLDGVLLYNPARVARPLIKTYKHLKRKNEVSFVLPKTALQTLLWNVLHLSSLFPAPGYSVVKKLVEADLIEAYIVTARYGSLHANTARWFDYLNRERVFTDCFENLQSEQPHLYKETKIRELGLDLFVDDNWDIVKHLSTVFRSSDKKIFWVSNLLDSRIDYPYKDYSFSGIMRHIEREALQ